MIRIRPEAERGIARLGWLDSRHTFSFGEYRDPAHMGFRNLRVINEDRVAPGKGFATHGHRDMEILTAVLAGALAHKDSLGNGSAIRPGDVQRMSAGTGVTHSEFNASQSEPVHFLQIWLLPDRADLAPSYEQRGFIPARGQHQLLASPDARDGSLRVNADADVYALRLEAGAKASFALRAGRHAWVQVIAGELAVNSLALAASDGAAISEERELTFAAGTACELLWFDLA